MTATLVAVGHSERFWPVAGWAVYTVLSPEPPGPSASLLEVRVTTHAGARYALPPHRLIASARSDVAEHTLRLAVQGGDTVKRAAARAHLTRLVTATLGTPAFDSIEVHQVVWVVDPMRVPPFERRRPYDVLHLASFPRLPPERTP